MNYTIPKYCYLYEWKDKVLIFNSLSLEIVLMSKKKFNSVWNEEEKKQLVDLGMLIGDKGSSKLEQFYTKLEVFPDHIEKAYLLFGTDCNIDCRYCTVKYNSINFNPQDSMSIMTFENSIRLLFDNNAIGHITLYGGEPLLHKDLIIYFFDFIERLPKEKRPNIDVITNGIINDEIIVEHFKKNDVLVIVSLDGFKSHHDMFRTDNNGCGTYDQVCRGISFYKNAGVRVGISMVIGRHNYYDLSIICKELKEEYDIVSIGMSLPHLQPDIVSDYEFDGFIMKNYSMILDICQELDLWFEQGMKKIYALANKQFNVYGCPVTKKGATIRILPNGDISLCENMGLRGHFILGNVNQKKVSLDKIINTSSFQKWYSRCTKIMDDCQGCISYSICGMGCPYDAYLEQGSIYNTESRACAISKQSTSWYLNRIIRQIELSDLESFKILNIQERNSVIVKCPWERK